MPRRCLFLWRGVADGLETGRAATASPRVPVRFRHLLRLASVLALAGAPTLLAARAQAGPMANVWAGTWSTNWGTMVLKQSGATVTGTYTHDDGQIVDGTASGRVLTGTWTEAPTRTGPRDAGSFRFEMAADLESFSGSWSYADGTQGNASWTGRRASPLPGAATTDRKPPVVRAFAPNGTARPGTRLRLPYSVKDDSGRATARVWVFQAGVQVFSLKRTVKVAANGQRQSVLVRLPKTLVGPLFFCVWAQDAAGNRSAGFPKSSCAWLEFLVPVERVSNGCGGEGWAPLVAIENYFGNTHTYRDGGPLARSYSVSFVKACDLHDAGYAGAMVKDELDADSIVDYRTWSRKQVDAKFYRDMLSLCRDAIPLKAKVARARCEGTGGPASIGARKLYNFVRKYGWHFFDSDLTIGDLQSHRPVSTRPAGGGRNNFP